MKPSQPNVSTTWAAALAVLILAACGNRYAPPPPPELTISHPIEKEITTYNEFTGHTTAYEAVDVRARVQGYLQSVNFVPGENVQKGALLFVIEPTLYEARVAQAQADLEGKEAQLKAAQAQLEITEAIFQRSAGSRSDLVAKTQARDLAKAQLSMARATLDAARLDLSYTHIFAPIDGRIDRNFVDVGNLVGSGQATALASIVHDDPIYVYFTASERLVLEYRELQRKKRTVAAEGQHNVAFLGLSTETGFPHPGRVDYVGNKVDPDSGTLEVRALFPNPDHVIVPGLFARVRLPFTRERAILVPDIAVLADQGGPYVLIVDDHDTVQYRRVQVGPLSEGDLRVVQSGLTPADWVVVNGLQRARPGGVIKPKRVEIASPAATPAAAPSPASAGGAAAS